MTWAMGASAWLAVGVVLAETVGRREDERVYAVLALFWPVLVLSLIGYVAFTGRWPQQ